MTMLIVVSFMNLLAFGACHVNQLNKAGTGSCLKAGLCCPGRDSTCVVQNAPLNSIIEDLSDKPCYCDHACLKVGDCCHDFKEACEGMLNTIPV
ncbi:UNVERIFIED_CONTAM: Somatomedin-B and thrombospondin type-1 domain-containing protein [Trichonephila clavipes]